MRWPCASYFFAKAPSTTRSRLMRGSRLVTLRECWRPAERLAASIEAEPGQQLATILESAGGQACTIAVAESAELLSGRQKGH